MAPLPEPLPTESATRAGPTACPAPAAALARRRRTLQTRCAIERGRVQANAQAWSDAARPAALLREARQALLHTVARQPLQALGLAALVALAVGAALAWRRVQVPQGLRAWVTLASAARWGWRLWRMRGEETRG